MSSIACGPIEAELRARLIAARARMGASFAPVRRVRRAPPPPPRPPLFIAAIEEVPEPCINLLTLPSWRVLASLVALKHGLSLNDIIAQDRRRHVVAARTEAMRLVDAHMDMSLPAMGRRFQRDHTTVLWALRKGDDGVFPTTHTDPILGGVDTQKALETAPLKAETQ